MIVFISSILLTFDIVVEIHAEIDVFIHIYFDLEEFGPAFHAFELTSIVGDSRVDQRSDARSKASLARHVRLAFGRVATLRRLC